MGGAEAVGNVCARCGCDEEDALGERLVSKGSVSTGGIRAPITGKPSHLLA